MKKLATKQLQVNLQEIENVINKHEIWEEEFWIYNLEMKDNNLNINIFDDEWLQETFIIEIVEDNIDIKSICKSIIDYLYENEINSRQNYINKNKSFNSRKIQSMAKWMGKGNIDKVTKINMELIERYNINIKMKSELSTYKSYACDFYEVLNTLYPTYIEVV
ncbi:hypothetical protein [Clostridium tagluense]|uniref:Uncharacterized protein n=1 Tax=Clostridium tagluense TaxID=360422 RepID=A0A401UPH1_9CLOT|nr:hypothetical protein [Clostridium tagluense]GCD11408.1 hypothetical protein Ctaglu_30310 [Clostridium tagluense]